MPVLFARQPIADAQGQLFGYELLFRQPDGSGPGADPGAAGTATVLWHAMVDLGLDGFGQGRALFVNVPDAVLDSDALEAIPSDRLVVEILETTAGGEVVADGIRRLRDRGIRIALDDYCPRTQGGLLPLADFVKVEVGDDVATAAVLEERGHASLIAERVETVEDVQRYVKKGFDLFQGYFFSRPEPVEGKSRDPHVTAQMRLLSELQRVDIGLSDVEKLIRQDPDLCLRILRLASSAHSGRSRQVSCVREAAARIGMDRLRGLAASLVLSGLARGNVEKPARALIRAQFCQALAPRRSCSPDSAFLVGLFSELDEVRKMTAEDLAWELGLPDDAVDALHEGKGPVADLLRTAIAYEGEESSSPLGASVEDARLYLECVQAAERLCASAELR